MASLIRSTEKPAFHDECSPHQTPAESCTTLTRRATSSYSPAIGPERASFLGLKIRRRAMVLKDHGTPVTTPRKAALKVQRGAILLCVVLLFEVLALDFCYNNGLYGFPEHGHGGKQYSYCESH